MSSSACALLLVDRWFIRMKIHFDPNFGNLRVVKHTIECRQVCLCEIMPMLQNLCAVMLDGCQRFALRRSGFRIGLPDLLVESARFTVHAAESEILGWRREESAGRANQGGEFLLKLCRGILGLGSLHIQL